MNTHIHRLCYLRHFLFVRILTNVCIYAYMMPVMLLLVLLLLLLLVVVVVVVQTAILLDYTD